MSKINSYFFKFKISVTFIMLIFSFFIVSEFFSTVASAETIKKKQITSSQAKQHRNQKTVSVISGGVNGTYIRFATDMSNVLDEKKKGGLRVLPIVGRGGGQNVIDVLFLKGVHMGIIQQEVTEFLKEKDPVLYKNVGKKVHYITKLYNAEFTMVARKDIKSLEDLKGKTVSFWKPWSATDVGGQTILKKLGLDKDIKVVHMDTSLGIQKVKDGEIAAVMLVAGAPIGGFKDLKSTEGLHFVPISKKSLPNHDFSKVLDVYLPSHLRHEDYPFMIAEGETVSTVVSSAVLVVYNFSESSSEYKKIEVFVNSLFDNWAKFLKPSRHPKWKNINFAAKIPGWVRFKPAEEWLAKNKTNRP